MSAEDDRRAAYIQRIEAARVAARTSGSGESAYDIAVRNGFTGTEAEWLESLQGERGPRGPSGTATVTMASVLTALGFTPAQASDIAAAVAAHEALANPHPTYLTEAEADLLYEALGGGGGGTAVTSSVSQTAHGFSVGAPVKLTSAGWVAADADAETTMCDAMVSAVADADNFTVTEIGQVTLTTGQWDARTGDFGGLTKGEYYWLSTTAGFITKTQPTSGFAQCLGVAESTTVLRFAKGPVVAMAGPATGGWNVIVKREAESRTSSTTLTADSVLQLALAANTRYIIRVNARGTIANATMDYKFRWNYSGTTTDYTLYQGFTLPSPNGTDSENVNGSIASGAILNLDQPITGATSGFFRVWGELEILTNAAGTFSFQWAQNTSDAGAIVIRPGSTLEYMQL